MKIFEDNSYNQDHYILSHKILNNKFQDDFIFFLSKSVDEILANIDTK